MEQHRFDAWTRRRFGAAAGGFIALAALGGSETATSRRARKRKGKGNNGSRCTKDGQRCTREGSNCKNRYCLKAPFTITASWTEDADHDTYVFVPRTGGPAGPAPYIEAGCSPNNSSCQEAYPFACGNGDKMRGEEIVTIHKLLPGQYEYWSRMYGVNNGGELTVTLRDRSGRVVGTWQNPPGGTSYDEIWHVFDLDGARGSITPRGEKEEPGTLPDGAYLSNIDVCPYDMM